MSFPKSRYVGDETAPMRRLVCGFVITNHRRQGFSVAVQLQYVILPRTLRKQDAKFDFREILYNSDRIAVCM